MAAKRKKAVRQQTAALGEQMDLIDVGPENLELMKPVARRCKVAEKNRAKAADDKKKAEAEIVELVKNAKLTPSESGLIVFVVDGLRVKIKPDQWTVCVTETQ